jgi:hypothetical protein
VSTGFLFGSCSKCCPPEEGCQSDEDCCYCLFEFVTPEPLSDEDFATTQQLCENCGGVFTDLGGNLASCQQLVENPNCTEDCSGVPNCIGGLPFFFTGYCCEGECSDEECNPLP